MTLLPNSCLLFYNSDGDRISQTVNGTLTTYVLDIATPLTMVLSETSNGSTLHYWQGLDVLAQSDGTQTEYLAYDGLGSARQVTDSAGLVEMAQTFDPYGNLYARSGVNSTIYGFTGEAQDDNGLLFLRARYYSASSGRFLNTDPSRQEQNAYLYASSNPVLYVDPAGLMRIIKFADWVGAGGPETRYSAKAMNALRDYRIYIGLSLERVG